MDKYNIEYKGVTCTAVDWESTPFKFVFLYDGKEYVFEQKRYISQSADTDHIKCAIEQFFEFECIKCKYNERKVNGHCYNEVSKDAINYIAELEEKTCQCAGGQSWEVERCIF